MAGYVRQSAADIVPTSVVRAAPINNELNALRDAFAQAGGHRHDGTASEGAYVPLISDLSNRNKVVVDSVNNRISFFISVSSSAIEQLRIVDGALLPVIGNDIDLGNAAFQFKDLWIDGAANIDSLIADTADINGGTIDGTVIGNSSPSPGTFTNLTVNSSAVIASLDANAGTIDNTVIGNSVPNSIRGTTITALSGLSGTLTGNVIGNVTGNVTGTVNGALIGNVTGNVTASSGTSTFSDVVINGNLNMNASTSATITNLTTPTSSTDAATKGYVDNADALKLSLSGGTMSGNISMGNNKVTNIGAPSTSTDAATKGYVDTAISNLVDSSPGTLDTLNELAAALGDDPNFATTITASIATKLSLSGGTMTGAIAMGSNKITGLGTPTDNADATTKIYVDNADALKLSLSGGTMTGAIAMSTNKITGVGDPTANQDAATKNYVDTQDATRLSLSGGTMTGDIVMGANKITSTASPTTDDDLTRKGYVDTILGSATSAAASAAAAAVSESNAAGSASAASSSASSALSSANAAAASYDSFDDRYLGAKTADPTLDNDGNALITGALYFNSVAGEMRVWDGSAWLVSYLPAAGYLALSGGTMSGAITFAGVQTWPTFNQNTTGTASNVTGTVAVANGGTGATTLTGYVKGNGTSAFSASTSIPNTDITGLGTMSTQNASNVAITGGAIDGATIGATTASTGKFTTVTATSGISGGTF